MSTIYGTIDAGKAGLITFMPEGKAEEQLDAISTDVIEQGAIIFRDTENATPALRKWKKPGTGGSQVGPWGICTKAKAAGETKVTGVWGAGFEGTVWADGAIEPDDTVIASTTTDGQVISGENGFARYLRRYKYANDGDGNHQKVAAEDGDLIVIKLL